MNLNKSDPIHITKEIFQVGGHQLISPEDAAIYLINFNGHAALMDADSGDGRDRLIADIKACGVDLDQLNTF